VLRTLTISSQLHIFYAGAHPGGGVMGAAGRNCAHIVMSDVLGK
jgi:phytoene dehydrogenase-like protein